MCSRCTLFLAAIYTLLHYSIMLVDDSNISSFFAFAVSLESIFMWLTVSVYPNSLRFVNDREDDLGLSLPRCCNTVGLLR